MTNWTNPSRVGFLPHILRESDPRPAAEQLHDRYAHGGGFQPFEGFKLASTEGTAELHYPGDPPMYEVSRATLRDETLILFDYEWLAIVQPSGSFVTVRVD